MGPAGALLPHGSCWVLPGGSSFWNEFIELGCAVGVQATLLQGVPLECQPLAVTDTTDATDDTGSPVAVEPETDYGQAFPLFPDFATSSRPTTVFRHSDWP
jgi:hypothetical protein